MRELSPKERVLRAIRHEELDRVPMQLGKTPAVTDALSKLTGRTGVDLAIHLGEDVLSSPFDPWGYYGGRCSDEGATFVDYWGITRAWISQPAGGSYTDVLVNPLAEATSCDLTNCAWPDLLAHPSLFEVEGFVRDYGSEYFIVGGAVSIFEASFNLIGYERFLMDLLVNKLFITQLVEILTVLQIPPMVREIEQGVDVVVANHNCGDCRAIIPDWMEIGMQVLYPVQPRAMDPAELKRLYGDRLCFRGGVDEQWVLPFGTTQDVIDEVKLRLRQLAPGGG